MRLLKLKHGPRVSEHSSGAVQPSVDRDAVFANHYPSQNFFEILESSVGCALLVFTFLSSSCYADPMTYTVNDGTVRDMWGDEEAEKLGHRISWKQWYDLNIDEAKRQPDAAGWAGRNIREGDKVVVSDGWKLIFPVDSNPHKNAISLNPRLYTYNQITKFLSSISITGKDQGNSLVIQGQDQSTHRGIYIFYWNELSDEQWESNPPKVSIENVDLEVTHVRYGIDQPSPSIVEISNEKTVIDCSASSGSRAFNVSSMLASEKPRLFSISIDSGHIEAAASPQGAIIYQRLSQGSSVINLNLKREGITLFKAIENEPLSTFNMYGKQVTTNIGGETLYLQNAGSVAPYRPEKGNSSTTQLVGGHSASISGGAHLNLFSKNIKGAVVFNVGSGGRLSIGSEENQPKVEMTGGFEFVAKSGKSQVYLGPGSLLNGYISDETQASSGDSSPTFLMKNSTWDVNSQLSRVQNLASKVSGLKLDHATVNLTSEQDAQGQQTFSDLTIGSLESDRGVFILDVDIENQKNDKVVITEGIPAGGNLQEAREKAEFDPTENLLKSNSALRFAFTGTSSGGDSGVLVESPIVVEGTRFQLEPKELEVNGKKAKYQAVDVGTYNYYLANKESATDPNTRTWYLTQCKEGECLPLPSPPEPEPPDDPDKPENPDQAQISRIQVLRFRSILLQLKLYLLWQEWGRRLLFIKDNFPTYEAESARFVEIREEMCRRVFGHL